MVVKLWLAQGFTGLPYSDFPLLKQVMPGGQVEVLHSQDNGYFYIPLASIITAVMFAPKVVATKFSLHLASQFIIPNANIHYEFLCLFVPVFLN